MGCRGRYGTGLVAALLLSFVAACTGSGTAAGIETVARADGWRTGLFEELGERHHTVLEIAFDVSAAQLAWAENVPDELPNRRGRPDRPGRYGAVDDIDFDEQVLVVWSSGSSSCPSWVHDIATAEGTVRVTTRERVGGDGCQDIYTPYRLLLVVDRDRLPGPTELDDSHVTIDGREPRLPPLVIRYPAALG